MIGVNGCWSANARSPAGAGRQPGEGEDEEQDHAGRARPGPDGRRRPPADGQPGQPDSDHEGRGDQVADDARDGLADEHRPSVDGHGPEPIDDAIARDTRAGGRRGKAPPAWTFEALLRELVDEERYPRLYRIAWADTAAPVQSPGDEEREFQFGLERILDGVQALIERCGEA
jgi:hypothetical protein